jgi:phosphoribosylglycinamide formyltransferase-1
LRFSWLHGWGTRDGVGIFGPFGVAPRARGSGLGRTLLLAALVSLRERGYRHALIPAVGGERLIAYYVRETGARVVEEFRLVDAMRRARVAVLASGNGTNFQAVVDAARAGTLLLDVARLIVNRADAYALRRAAAAGIPANTVVWDRRAESRTAFDARLIAEVERSEPELVLLLGWMHVLPAAFLDRFRELLNIHPAFLPIDPSADTVTMPDGEVIPAFRGAHAVDDALSAGVGWTGATAHRVDLATDRGEVLMRAPLRLAARETKDAVMERLHPLEHRVLTGAIRRWALER